MAFMGILLCLAVLLLFFGGIIAGIILLLIGIFARKTAFVKISLTILVPAVIILLIVGIISNIKKHKDMKSLYYCIDNEYYSEAEKLLQNGASPYFTINSNEPAKNGEVPYFVRICQANWGSSEYEKSSEKIQFLLEHGLDTEYRVSFFGHKKDDPSHFADEESKNVSPCGDSCGSTPLMCAASCGNAEVVKVLIENGADVNAVSYCGKTALMFACYKNGGQSVEIVRLLLEKGADANAADNFGLTVMDYAEYFEQSRIKKILQKHINK